MGATSDYSFDGEDELPVVLLPYFETPQQWADSRRPKINLAERRMYAAAFKMALADCSSCPVIGGRTERLARNRRHRAALAWLNSDDKGFLSFRWYCELFGALPHKVRARVEKGEVRIERAEARV